MEKWELTEDELQHASGFRGETATERAIANAASDKGYTTGRQGMARETREWMARFRMANLIPQYDEWLKSKGVM